MINNYFDFQKFFDEEVCADVPDWRSYFKDYEVELDKLNLEEALSYMQKIPFPICLSECDIDFDNRTIIFNFSEEYDNSTEVGTDISFCAFYVVYSIRDEIITTVRWEQG